MAKKYVLYCLVASALVLAKESGLMLFPVLGLFVIWEAISERRKLRDFINHIIIYLLPFFVFCVFMLMQKMKWGWYVFPDHVAFINFSFNHTIDKLELFFDFVFFQEGRIYTSGLAVLVLLVISLVRKYNQPLKKEQVEILIICFGFTLIYSYFSAVNFYTQRYLLSLLPIYALVISAAFYRLKNMHLVKKVLSVLIIGLGFYLYSMGSNNSLGDTSQGHKSMVLLHKSVISDFVLPNRDSSFSVGFLLSEYLKYPEMGYLNQTDPSDFKLVNINDADFLVASSINLMEDRLEYCRENGECNLVYSKEEGLAWVKVYETKY